MKFIDTLCNMTKKRKQLFFIFLIFSILWAAAIFNFSSRTAAESSKQSGFVTRIIASILEPGFNDMSDAEQAEIILKYVRIVRKSAHFCAFALLGFLTYFCVGVIKFLPHGLFIQATISIPFCALFAVTDELHQKFVDGRSCRLTDVGIDVCGVFFGTLCAILLSLLYRHLLFLKEKKAKEL